MLGGTVARGRFISRAPKACAEAIDRIFRKQPQYRDDPTFFVGFLAMTKSGEVGAVGSGRGFQYSLYRDGMNSVNDAPVF